MATTFTDIIVSGSTNTTNLNSSSVNATNGQITNILNDNLLSSSITTNQIIGSGSGSTSLSILANDINIGSVSSNVNILGQLNYIKADILEVKDPLITLNKGGTDSLAVGGGFEIAGSSNIIKASMKTDANLDFLITSPNDRLTLGNLNVNGTATINNMNIANGSITGNVLIGNVLTTKDLVATGNILLSGANVAFKNNVLVQNGTYYPLMGNVLGGNGSPFTTSVFTYIQAGVPSLNVNGQITNNADAILGNGNDQIRCRKNLNVDSVARVGYNDATNLAGLSANGANLDVLGNIYTTTNVRAAQSLFSNGNLWVAGNCEVGGNMICSNIVFVDGSILGNLSVGNTLITNDVLINGNLTTAININEVVSLNAGNINIGVGSSVNSVINIGSSGNTWGTLRGYFNIPSSVNNQILFGSNATTLSPGIPLAIRNISNIDDNINASLSGNVYPQLSFGSRNWTWAQDITNDQTLFFGCAGAGGADPDFDYYFKRGVGLKIQPGIIGNTTDFNDALYIQGTANITGQLTTGAFRASNITVGVVNFDRTLATPTVSTHLGFVVDSGWVATTGTTTTRIVRNVTSITLSAGVWLLTASCSWAFGTGILVTGNQIAFCIGTGVGSDPYAFLDNDNCITYRGWDRLDTGSSLQFYNDSKQSFSIIRNVSATTTYYLNGTGGNSSNGASVAYRGQLTAIRIG